MKAPPATKSPAKTAPANKTPANKAPAKKTSATKTPAKTAPANKTPANKAPAKKASATKTPSKTAPAKKAAPARAPAAHKASSASGATTVSDADLNVAGLTAADLTEIRGRLQSELAEMQLEYQRSISELNDLRQFQSDGAGDDQADVGSKTFEREQEQSIAANRLLLLTQIEHAVERIDSGAYGVCEDCGKPIPKARLKALPMATLDAECKALAERH